MKISINQYTASHIITKLFLIAVKHAKESGIITLKNKPKRKNIQPNEEYLIDIEIPDNHPEIITAIEELFNSSNNEYTLAQCVDVLLTSGVIQSKLLFHDTDHLKE